MRTPKFAKRRITKRILWKPDACDRTKRSENKGKIEWRANVSPMYTFFFIPPFCRYIFLFGTDSVSTKIALMSQKVWTIAYCNQSQRIQCSGCTCTELALIARVCKSSNWVMCKKAEGHGRIVWKLTQTSKEHHLKITSQWVATWLLRNWIQNPLCPFRIRKDPLVWSGQHWEIILPAGAVILRTSDPFPVSEILTPSVRSDNMCCVHKWVCPALQPWKVGVQGREHYFARHTQEKGFFSPVCFHGLVT